MSDPFSFLSSPGPTTTTTQGSDSFIQPYWQQYVNQGINTINNNPIQPYGGPTVAPQNFAQNSALDMQYNLATGGSPAGNAANSAITAQALGANIANPYATTLNPYMGVDPYTQQVINSTNSNMADAYQNGTAAQTAAAFNQANAFGGSAYQNTMAQNNKAFANAVGNTDSQLLNQNYYNNANLAENSINRATGAYQNGLQQQLSAAGLGLQSQGMDQNAIMGLNTLGTQQQGNTQGVLNAMGNYYTQAQQAPYMNLDLTGNILNNYSNANRVMTQQGPPTSGITNGAALIGAGYTLFGPNGLFPVFGGSGSSSTQPNGTGYVPMAPFNPQPLP